MNQEILDLLGNAVHDSIDNYVVTVGEGNKKGEGYLGEFIIVSLKNKATNEVTNLAVKQSTFNTPAINGAFSTEIYVYSVIWPKLQEFKKTWAPGLRGMDLLPKCFATNLLTEKKRLVLENLKLQNYELYDRTQCFDKAHMKLIFETYAKLHALSFAFKDKDPENFREITSRFDDQVEGFENIIMMLCDPMQRFAKRMSEEYVGEYQNEIREKMAVYASDTKEHLSKSFFYSGDSAVLVHGDCWSNNLFFKYDESRNPVQMKLIDLQLVRTASPVHDLSYACYSGASKEILDDLDYYLKIYHDTLSKILKEFNYEANIIYPFSKLKEDWKQYCCMGFLFALLIWAGKLMISNVPTIGDRENANGGIKIEESSRPIIDEIKYSKVTTDLVLHMYKNNFM